MEYKLK